MRRIALLILALVAAIALSIYRLGALRALTPLALVLLAACALLSWAFVIRHARTSWWTTPGGRYLMKSKTAFALLFSLTLMAQLVPMLPLTRVVLSVAMFGWIAYVLIDLLLMQSKELQVARDEKQGNRDIARDINRDIRRDGPRDIARDAAHDDRNPR